MSIKSKSGYGPTDPLRREIDALRKLTHEDSLKITKLRSRLKAVEKALRNLVESPDWPWHKEWQCEKGDPCHWCAARTLLKETT